MANRGYIMNTAKLYKKTKVHRRGRSTSETRKYPTTTITTEGADNTAMHLHVLNE